MSVVSADNLYLTINANYVSGMRIDECESEVGLFFCDCVEDHFYRRLGRQMSL